jgi:hypothetical protein
MKNIEEILNDCLNKALCQKGRIQQPSSNTIAEFVSDYLKPKEGFDEASGRPYLKLELDRKGLETLVKGSYPYYDAFDHKLVNKAGHSYTDFNGKTHWDSLEKLTELELYFLYLVCRKSWNSDKKQQK